MLPSTCRFVSSHRYLLASSSTKGMGVRYALSRQATAVRFHNKTLSSSSSKWKSFLTSYSRVLDSHPITTKCLTAGAIGGAGDLLSQTLQIQNYGSAKSWLHVINWRQTARFVFINTIFVGPILHYWYKWLGMSFPGTHAASVVKRVLIDEFIFTPLYYPFFLAILWKLEQSSLSFASIGGMLWRELPTLLCADWLVYVPAQTINFRFVPGKFQVLFANMIGIAWNGYLSFTAQQAQKESKDANNERKMIINLVDEPENMALMNTTLVKRKETSDLTAPED